MVSMVTDHRVPKKYAGRLVLQEFDAAEGRMKGPARDIYCAEEIFLEGPHIFRREGWYYLFSADTGTGEGHGQTIQRSRNVWGPYEMYRPVDQKRQEGEAYSILTSRHHEDIALQKAGHCDLRIGYSEGVYYGGNIGYRVEELYRGCHYAGKACLLLFELAKRHGMEYLIITCNPENVPSRKTCEWLGGELLEIAELPEDSEQRRLTGESHRCIYKFRL